MVDSLLLGLMSTYKSVGIYAAASKLNRILCIVIASVGNVLVPRISNLVSLGEAERAGAILTKSMRISIALTLPLAFGFFLLADQLVAIMYGVRFLDSVLICRILAPIIIITGVSNVFTIQLLLTHSRERELFIVYLTGTLVTLIFNAVLIYYFDAPGAAVAMLFAEMFICVVAWKLTKRVCTLPIPWGYLFSCLAFCTLFWPIVYFAKQWVGNVWAIVGISFALCGSIYFVCQLIFYKSFITEEIFSLLSRKQAD